MRRVLSSPIGVSLVVLNLVIEKLLAPGKGFEPLRPYGHQLSKHEPPEGVSSMLE